MPEVYFHIQWPDGEVTRCYSPSTIIREYFQTGATLTIEELAARSSEALAHASARVRDKFGFDCTSASSQLRDILSRARGFLPEDQVKIVSVD